ncbi:MAG: RNA polymerase sigma factor, partial [Pseudonocardiaceae bacterium]
MCYNMQQNLAETSFAAEALPHRRELQRVATRRLANSQEAEDIVQEVYLQAWRSFRKYQTGTNCRAWLHRILQYKLDHHRRRAQTQHKYFAPECATIPETCATANVISFN